MDSDGLGEISISLGNKQVNDIAELAGLTDLNCIQVGKCYVASILVKFLKNGDVDVDRWRKNVTLTTVIGNIAASADARRTKCDRYRAAWSRLC